MSEIQFDELPMEPDAIKAAIRVRREAVAIMLREVSILSENLRKKIGPVAMIQWMATQANAVDEVLKTNTEFVNKGKPEGDT
jgi:hypothetical protein